MIHNIRIRSWLESIEYGNTENTEVAPPAKRRRTCDNPSDTLVAQLGDPALGTPPSTLIEDKHMPRVTINLKRTAVESSHVDSAPGAAAADLEKTPTKPRKILLPAPRKRQRSSSPTKSRTGLQLLEKPVNIVDLSGQQQQLPSDVETLYSEIQNAVEFKLGILPSEVPDPAGWLGRQPPSHCFRKPELDDPSRVRAVHVALCRIRRAAMKSAQCQRHEQAWNNMVHTPLLELVFQSNNETDREDVPSTHIASYEPVMTATIAGDSIPLLSGAGLACSVSASSTGTGEDDEDIDITQVHSSSSSKKVDYALVLHLSNGSALFKLVRDLANEVAVRDREPAPHFNQTTYLPVAYAPIAVSIETKPQFSSQDPLIQLGLWTAAWHKRMSYLRSQLNWSAPDEAPPRLVSLPLIQVVGHHWHMYFACDLGEAIVMHGPVSLGSTESLMAMYALFTCLKAIKLWIEGQFSLSIASWFGL